MEGREFREFVGGLLNEGTPEERIQNIDNFRRIRDELCVLARSSPEDKYIMTVGLR
jgi:Ca2+ transporting ATPase